MFCNGMVTLPDGRVLINGGNLQYDPFHGQPRNAVFDPATGLFIDVQNMAHGRWYPTTTLLGDGRVMTFSGLNETGARTRPSRSTRRLWMESGIDRRRGRRRSTLACTCCRTGASSTRAQGPARDSSIPRRNVVGRRRHHQLQRHAHLRHLGAAAVDAGERLHSRA